MRKFILTNKRLCDDLIGCVPGEKDYDTIIYPPAMLTVSDGGFFEKTIGIYDCIPNSLMKKARIIASNAKVTDGLRTYGLPVSSAIFGSLPRIAIRQNYCRLTRNSVEQPQLLDLSLDFAVGVSKLYSKSIPKEYERHLKITRDNVHDEWIIPGTPFTTINFNLNNAIRYHRDKANQSGVMSNVIIIKKDVDGGLLVLPEYRIALSQNDGAIIIFDGQHIIHGVTPLTVNNDDGYRCSIVMYTLNGMKDCYPFSDEIEWAKKRRTAVENEYRSLSVQNSINKASNQIIARDAKRKKTNGTTPIVVHTVTKRGFHAMSFHVRSLSSDVKAIEETIGRNTYLKRGVTVEKNSSWTDLGANIGGFSVWAFAHGAASVVSVEANDVNASLCAKNITENKYIPDVRCVAVVEDSYSKSTVVIYTNNNPLAFRRHSVMKARKDSYPVEIPAMRFTELVKNTCVKMNVEGSEISILRDVEKITSPNFVSEYSFDVNPSMSVFWNIIKKLKRFYGRVELSKNKIPLSGDFPFYPPNCFIYASELK